MSIYVTAFSFLLKLGACPDPRDVSWWGEAFQRPSTRGRVTFCKQVVSTHFLFADFFFLETISLLSSTDPPASASQGAKLCRQTQLPLSFERKGEGTVTQHLIYPRHQIFELCKSEFI